MSALLGNKLLCAGLFLLVSMVSIAVGAPLLTSADPAEQNIANQFASPSFQHLMGTDRYGRDIFSRLLYGTRLSLLIAISAAVLGGLIGTVLGTSAGYFGGFIDKSAAVLVDTLMTFPSLMIGIAVVAFLGAGLRNLIIALAIGYIPQFTRIARSYTLSIRENDYIQAAKAIGCGNIRILVRHVLPNLIGPTTATASLYVTQALRDSAALHYLGLGVSPPTPTIGNVLQDGIDSVVISPWGVLSATFFLVVLGLSFNLIGDGLRDLYDPRLRGKQGFLKK